jgi:hypothetical protein
VSIISQSQNCARRLPFRAVSQALLCLLLAEQSARAEIVYDPDSFDPALVAEVNAAVAAWQSTTDCRDNRAFQHLLSVVQDPHSRWQITIHRSDDRTSHGGCWKTAISDPRNPQLGAPCDIWWNPSGTPAYTNPRGFTRPVVARDPKAALIHELAHAAQSVEGTLPDDTFGAPGTLAPPYEQLGGTYVENMYRRSNGMPMREFYAQWTLPFNTYLPCCGILEVPCNDRCCVGADDCTVPGSCVCGIGLDPCPGIPDLCCPPGSSCNAGSIDSPVPRVIPPFCCPPNTFACGFRPGGLPNPSQVTCCASGQRCDSVQGCLSP